MRLRNRRSYSLGSPPSPGMSQGVSAAPPHTHEEGDVLSRTPLESRDTCGEDGIVVETEKGHGCQEDDVNGVADSAPTDGEGDEVSGTPLEIGDVCEEDSIIAETEKDHDNQEDDVKGGAGPSPTDEERDVVSETLLERADTSGEDNTVAETDWDHDNQEDEVRERAGSAPIDEKRGVVSGTPLDRGVTCGEGSIVVQNMEDEESEEDSDVREDSGPPPTDEERDVVSGTPLEIGETCGEAKNDIDSQEDDEALAVILAESMNKYLKASISSREENTIAEEEEEEEEEGILSLSATDSAVAAAIALKTEWVPAENSLPKVVGVTNPIAKKDMPRNLGQLEKNLVDGLLVPPLDRKKQQKLLKKNLKETTGANWFDMAAPTVTPELKKELQLLKLRNVIDPKRHYKANDTKGLPKYFQVGTVVEGPADFYSGRMTKREQKQTFADELLSNSQLKSYRKRKYTELQELKQAGRKKFYKQKKNRQKPSFAKD